LLTFYLSESEQSKHFCLIDDVHRETGAHPELMALQGPQELDW